MNNSFIKEGIVCWGVGPKIFSQSSWGDNRGQGGNASYKVLLLNMDYSVSLFCCYSFQCIHIITNRNCYLDYFCFISYLLAASLCALGSRTVLFYRSCDFLDESVYKNKGFVCVDRY